MPKKISYTTLQKKYAGKLLALSRDESKVLASADDAAELEKKLKKKNLDPSKLIFWGPIEEYGRTYVYPQNSLREKEN